MNKHVQSNHKNGDYPVEINLTLTGDPQQKLEQGKKAAAALMTVAKPVLIDGKQFLRFEDLQTIGAFFGTIVGTSNPEYVEIDNTPGYKASAAVRRISDGLIISTASAYCLREGNWKNRENYALASMAQTRAGAKALRNAFAWVAVLAGYEATPAEEIATNASQEPAFKSQAPATVKQLDYLLFLSQEKYGKEDGFHRIESYAQKRVGHDTGQELFKHEASAMTDMLYTGQDLPHVEV